MKHIIIAALWLLTSVAMAAQSAGTRIERHVAVPGTLAEAVGADTDATGLTVTGTIDVRDLDFIADRMPALGQLSLQGASIAAWEGERALSSMRTFPANCLPPLSLAGCRATAIILPATLRTIADGALAGAAIKTLEIPAGVTTIGTGAFAGCPNLSSITIPATVTAPGSAMFRGCGALATVTYEASAVPDLAFAECGALREVVFGKNLSLIGNDAFRGDAALTTVSIPHDASGLTSIGDHAFHGTSIAALDLSSHRNLSRIGAWAFAGCKKLESFRLPATAVAPGDAAFFGDAALTDFSPSNPLAVSEMAFKGVEALDLRNVGGTGAEEFGRYAFHGMKALTTVHLPDNLRLIGDHAFDGCTSLRSMNAPAITTVPALGGDDVWGTLDKGGITLNVPANMKQAFMDAPVWCEFNIKAPPTTDIPDTLIPGAGGQPAVAARFDGTVLTVTADTPIDLAAAFDVTGRLLWQCTPHSLAASTETAGWPGRVYILKVVAGGTSTAIKAAR